MIENENRDNEIKMFLSNKFSDKENSSGRIAILCEPFLCSGSVIFLCLGCFAINTCPIFKVHDNCLFFFCQFLEEV